MNSKFLGVIFMGSFLLANGLARAEGGASDQEKLEKEQAQIDAAVIQSGGTIAKTLSEKFKIKPEALQKIRGAGPELSPGGGPEWGEITIMLSMARELFKTNPADYSTYDKALEKVRGLRAENAAYEKIAKQLEFNLQPVIAEIRRIRVNLQGEKRF